MLCLKFLKEEISYNFLDSNLFAFFQSNIVLPSKESMLSEIDKFKNEMKKLMFDSKGDYVNVRQGPYQDEMAGLIGCRPNIGKMALVI